MPGPEPAPALAQRPTLALALAPSRPTPSPTPRPERCRAGSGGGRLLGGAAGWRAAGRGVQHGGGQAEQYGHQPGPEQGAPAGAGPVDAADAAPARSPDRPSPSAVSRPGCRSGIPGRQVRPAGIHHRAVSPACGQPAGLWTTPTARPELLWTREGPCTLESTRWPGPTTQDPLPGSRVDQGVGGEPPVDRRAFRARRPPAHASAGGLTVRTRNWPPGPCRRTTTRRTTTRTTTRRTTTRTTTSRRTRSPRTRTRRRARGRPGVPAGGRRGRVGLGGLAAGRRLGAGRAGVGAVEARALEDDADRVEDLAQPPLARRALGQRLVGEGLHRLELVTARGAGVLVRGHVLLRIWARPVGTRRIRVPMVRHRTRVRPADVWGATPAPYPGRRQAYAPRRRG